MSTIDLEALADDELDVLAHDVDAERGRRRALADAPVLAAALEAEHVARLDEVAASWHAATGQGTGTLAEPVPYRPATGGHNAWPKGSVVVTDDGRVWLSTRHNEAHDPGDPHSGWVEQRDPDDGHAVWALDVRYRDGDRVHYPDADGPMYRCTHEHISAPGWEPDTPTMHAVWTKETP